MAVKSYQSRVADWFSACFPPSARTDQQERIHRFLEEALELAQACGCLREDVEVLVDYVFSRPEGAPAQEVGGVLVTLAALCSAMHIDMVAAGDQELQRNWDRIETIRRKQASKPQGSPLPQ